LPEIAIPPLNLTEPVNKLDEIVASETTNVPERFAFVANVFHLSVEEPKLYPEVPGIKASVPAESLIVTKVKAPAGVDPGENEPLYPVKEIVFTASPFIDIDSVPTPALSFQ
jgi:hypothetical protein